MWRIARYGRRPCVAFLHSSSVCREAAGPTANAAGTVKMERRPKQPPEPATEIVKMMHDELIETLAKKDFFPNKQLYEMFQACGNRTDLNLALNVLGRLHKARASNLKQFEGFNSEVIGVVTRTFIRLRSPRAALDVLAKYNYYGLSPHINASHELLKLATETNDSRFTRTILKNMIANSITPTALTAHIIMRQCIKREHIGTLLLIAKEFHANGIELYPATYDVLLASAANTGRIKMFEEVHQWRQHYNIRPSTSSVFSLAKARVLKGKVEEAAQLIVDGCKNPGVIQRFVGLMVRQWPGELAMSHTGSKKSAQSCTLKTKSTLRELLTCLERRGCKLDIDIDKDFGSSEGYGDKWEHCFGRRDSAGNEES